MLISEFVRCKCWPRDCDRVCECVCVRTRVCVWIIQKTVTGYQSNAYSRISMDGFEKEGVGVSARKDYQESIFLVSLYLSLIEQ